MAATSYKCRKALLKAVTEYIWRFFVTPQRPSAHLDAFFGKHVPLGNVVITFNWDLTVERALARERTGVPIVYQYSKALRP
jgi:hypothetical protein